MTGFVEDFEAFFCFYQTVNQRFDGWVQRYGVAGWAYAFFIGVEQFNTELAGEFLDVLPYCRARYAEDLGGFGEATKFVDRQE